MCRLRNIGMRDYQESVTTGQTDGQTIAGQSDPYVPLCFAARRQKLYVHNVPHYKDKYFWYIECHMPIYTTDLQH